MSLTDPWNKAYYYAFKPWQPSTVVPRGCIRINGGKSYICSSAGTTASTAGPTVTGVTAGTDGSAQWLYDLGRNIQTNDLSRIITSWAVGTSYTLGQFVVANGGVYACVVAGMSAAAGGGPSTTSNSISDGVGALVWSYQGVYRTPIQWPDFPVYSSSTSAPAALGVNLNPQVYPQGTSVQGATPIAGGSGYVVNDTITIADGSIVTPSTVQCVLKVTAVTSGAVTSVTVQTAGAYTALPPNTAAQGSTSGSGTGATFALRWPDPPWCSVLGAYVQGSGSSHQVRLAVFTATANSAPVSQHVAVEFYSDAPVIAFERAANAVSMTMCVDNQRVMDCFDTNSGSTLYHTLDFSNSGGRKIRHYRMEIVGSFNLTNVRVDSNSSVWPVNKAAMPVIVDITDSIHAGAAYGPWLTGNPVSNRLALSLDCRNMWSFTQGGTGYTNRGAGAGVTTDIYGYRVTEAIAKAADLILVKGSINDCGSGNTTSANQAAVLAMLQALRTGGYSNLIFVFGIWPNDDTSLSAGAKIADYETTISNAVTAFNDSKTRFIPIRNDPYVPWLTVGGVNNTNLTSSTNSNIYLGGDGIHPLDYGSAYIAARMDVAIRATLNSLPSSAIPTRLLNMMRRLAV